MSGMTKKHYEMVASVLNDVALTHDLEDQQAFGQAVINLATRFAKDNTRFQSKTFLEAVYYNVSPAEGSGGGTGPVCKACGRVVRFSTFCAVSDTGKHAR